MDARPPEPPRPTPRPPKRLLFDRRYGWMYFDEWKDPSVEALAGGRGMFCILPIARNLLKIASQSEVANELAGNSEWYDVKLHHVIMEINVAACSVVGALKSHHQFSRLTLNANANSWPQKLMNSAERADLKLLTLRGDYSMDRTQTV